MNLFSALQPASHTQPIGKYSPGVRVPVGPDKALVFVSGQVASDESGNVIGAGDAKRQTEVVFANIDAVLGEAGGCLKDLVSVVIYITDMQNFGAVSGVRNAVLGNPAPSSTFVEVARLAIPEHLVEISGIAVIEANAAPAFRCT